MIDFNKIPSPCYVMEEDLLRKNLELIKEVKDKAGVEIILAFKSFAMWKSFPIFREYIDSSTASSVYEARLALEEFGNKAHTYSPAYTEADFPTIMKCSSHITFNSFSQFERFYPMVKADNSGISIPNTRKWKLNYTILVLRVQDLVSLTISYPIYCLKVSTDSTAIHIANQVLMIWKRH